MAEHSIVAELDRLGPAAAPARPAVADAQRYCRHLARKTYENFTVASLLLPKRLRQHFYNVYAYCRWADDLADETGDSAQSLALLDWWEEQLDLCYRGRGGHPVFVALAGTIEEFRIPRDPFADLLAAFRLDQRKGRYLSFDELLGYCRRSANPVGRLVLHLGRCCNARTEPLSDAICTGLQLANFWQDVSRDYAAGRVYIPLEDCRRYGYTEAMFARQEFNDAFRDLLRFQVERTEEFFTHGEALPPLVPPELRVDVELFTAGGREVLRAIDRIDYDVWRRRPVIGKGRQLMLLLAAWRRGRRKTAQGGR